MNKLYDSRFSNQTYAYRNNKSSLNAVNAIEEKIQSGKYSWALKVDILHFFDEMNWKILRGMLEKDIKEDDVLFLIEENVKSAMLEDSGELVEKRQGIYQGSGISPILSNIYMMEFDQWMARKEEFYV
ncbi:MAG: reverse transcriptase/maturase family protein, partial [Lachnospiraceae bacterium]|nr:reverse transcriptase/maturase family protein [Lachnospiraceae bacterium]